MDSTIIDSDFFQDLQSQFPRLSDYTSDELKSFTPGELKILKTAAGQTHSIGGEAKDVEDFVERLEIIQNIFSRYGDVKRIPPRTQRDENICYMGLLFCKLIIIQHFEPNGLEKLLIDLKI